MPQIVNPVKKKSPVSEAELDCQLYQEFMLYIISRNINKYHQFLHHEIEYFTGKTSTSAKVSFDKKQDILVPPSIS